MLKCFRPTNVLGRRVQGSLKAYTIVVCSSYMLCFLIVQLSIDMDLGNTSRSSSSTSGVAGKLGQESRLLDANEEKQDPLIAQVITLDISILQNHILINSGHVNKITHIGFLSVSFFFFYRQTLAINMLWYLYLYAKR